jgi:hypothetical protein
MMKKEDVQANIRELRIKQRDLMIKEDRREITYADYKEKITPIEQKITELNQQLIQILTAETNERLVMPTPEQVTVDEQIKKIKEERGTKVGRKRESGSWLSLILKALTTGECKNVSDVIKTVHQWRPGRDSAKTEHQIKVAIYRVKKQYPGPYQDYIWNEEQYKLERKTK